MIEIKYKPSKRYTLGQLRQISISTPSRNSNEPEVIDERLFFDEFNTGTFGLVYELDGQQLEKIPVMLEQYTKHREDYLKYLCEKVDYIALNGTKIFDASVLQPIEEGDYDEDIEA